VTVARSSRELTFVRATGAGPRRRRRRRRGRRVRARRTAAGTQSRVSGRRRPGRRDGRRPRGAGGDVLGPRHRRRVHRLEQALEQRRVGAGMSQATTATAVLLATRSPVRMPATGPSSGMGSTATRQGIPSSASATAVRWSSRQFTTSSFVGHRPGVSGRRPLRRIIGLPLSARDLSARRASDRRRGSVPSASQSLLVVESLPDEPTSQPSVVARRAICGR